MLAGHDIILTHVHCKGTFPRALAGMDGAAYVEDSRDTLDEEAVSIPEPIQSNPVVEANWLIKL